LVALNQPKRLGRKGADMVIIGLDYHPGFQQIAFVDTETGELQERRLQHREEAEKFYRDLAARGMKAIRNEGGLPHPGAGARVFRDRQRTEGSEVLSGSARAECGSSP